MGDAHRPAPLLGSAHPGGRKLHPGRRSSAGDRAQRPPSPPRRRRGCGARDRSRRTTERVRPRRGAAERTTNAAESPCPQGTPHEARGDARTGTAPCASRAAGGARRRHRSSRRDLPPVLAAGARGSDRGRDRHRVLAGSAHRSGIGSRGSHPPDRERRRERCDRLRRARGGLAGAELARCPARAPLRQRDQCWPGSACCRWCRSSCNEPMGGSGELRTPLRQCW